MPISSCPPKAPTPAPLSPPSATTKPISHSPAASTCLSPPTLNSFASPTAQTPSQDSATTAPSPSTAALITPLNSAAITLSSPIPPTPTIKSSCSTSKASSSPSTAFILSSEPIPIGRPFPSMNLTASSTPKVPPPSCSSATLLRRKAIYLPIGPRTFPSTPITNSSSAAPTSIPLRANSTSSAPGLVRAAPSTSTARPTTSIIKITTSGTATSFRLPLSNLNIGRRTSLTPPSSTRTAPPHSRSAARPSQTTTATKFPIASPSTEPPYRSAAASTSALMLSTSRAPLSAQAVRFPSTTAPIHSLSSTAIHSTGSSFPLGRSAAQLTHSAIAPSLR